MTGRQIAEIPQQPSYLHISACFLYRGEGGRYFRFRDTSLALSSLTGGGGGRVTSTYKKDAGLPPYVLRMTLLNTGSWNLFWEWLLNTGSWNMYWEWLLNTGSWNLIWEWLYWTLGSGICSENDCTEYEVLESGMKIDYTEHGVLETVLKMTILNTGPWNWFWEWLYWTLGPRICSENDYTETRVLESVLRMTIEPWALESVLNSWGKFPRLVANPFPRYK